MASTAFAAEDAIEVSDEQVQRAQRMAESLLKELAEAGADHPEVVTDLRGVISSLAASTAGFAASSEKVKASTIELDIARRSLYEVKSDEDSLQSTLKMTQEETTKTLGETMRVTNALHTSEKTLAEKRARIANMEVQKFLGAGWTSDQTRQKEELEAAQFASESHLTAVQSTLTSLRQEVSMLTSHVEHAQADKAKADKSISELKDSISSHRAAAGGLERSKEHKDRLLHETQVNIVRLTAELKEKTVTSEGGTREVLAAQEALKRDRQTLDRYLKEYERLQAKALRLTEDIDECMRQNQITAKEVEEIHANTEAMKLEQARIRKDKGRLEKLHSLCLEKIKETEGKIAATEARLSELMATDRQLEGEIIAEKKRLESREKEVQDVQKEKEVLTKGLAKQGDKSKGALAAVHFQEGAKRILETEIGAYIATMKSLRHDIEALQESRNRLVVDLEAAAQAYFTAAEGVKLQELQMAALERKLNEGETKAKQQQSLYDAVKTDRNSYSKALVIAHGELNEMKTEFTTLTRRIEALKEDIMSKDQQLVKRHFEHHRIEKESDSLRSEVTRVRKQVQACEHIAANQGSETKKLTSIVSEAEAEYTRQRKELEAVKAERSLLIQQLHKRDAELSEVYQKLQVQKSMLANGAAAFAKRVAERDEVAAKIAARKGELLLATTQLADTSALEAECNKLDEDLRSEKAKIRAMTEELERPINVHRWRGLQDRDPVKWAVVQRIHEVQRRVLEVRDTIRVREEEIKTAEGEYQRLRGFLAKAPSNELAETIADLTSALKDKGHQIKRLEADVEFARAKCEDYKRELARLDEAMGRANEEYVKKTRAARRRTTATGGSLALAAANASSAYYRERAGSTSVAGGGLDKSLLAIDEGASGVFPLDVTGLMPTGVLGGGGARGGPKAAGAGTPFAEPRGGISTAGSARAGGGGQEEEEKKEGL